MKSRKNQNKIVRYDNQSDVLYLGFKKGAEEEFAEIAPGITAELDSKGKIIGVEILNASELFKPVIKPIQRQLLQA